MAAGLTGNVENSFRRSLDKFSFAAPVHTACVAGARNWLECWANRNSWLLSRGEQQRFGFVQSDRPAKERDIINSIVEPPDLKCHGRIARLESWCSFSLPVSPSAHLLIQTPT